MKRKTEPNCKCLWCGKGFRVPPCRLKTAKYCSPKCRAAYRGKQSEKRVAMKCPACGTEFAVPQCHVDRRRYCSYECRDGDLRYRLLKSDLSSRQGNGMWSGGRVGHSDGYLCKYVGQHHPFSSNGYLLEHRYVMERHLVEADPDSPFLVKLGFNKYLSPEFHVHHRDEDKRNNSIDNLVCMTPSEHQKHHNAARRKA